MWSILPTFNNKHNCGISRAITIHFTRRVTPQITHEFYLVWGVYLPELLWWWWCCMQRGRGASEGSSKKKLKLVREHRWKRILIRTLGGFSWRVTSIGAPPTATRYNLPRALIGKMVREAYYFQQQPMLFYLCDTHFIHNLWFWSMSRPIKVCGP